MEGGGDRGSEREYECASGLQETGGKEVWKKKKKKGMSEETGREREKCKIEKRV